MRRTAVLAVCIALGSGCPTEKWLLPGGGDAGLDAATDSSGSGGKTIAGSGGMIFGTGGRGGIAGIGGAGQPTCRDKSNLRFAQGGRADVIFSLGRNASMATAFGNGTRMSVVQQAVRNVVMIRENVVNFGYQDFPSAASCMNSAACCSNSQAVFPSPRNFIAIDQAMRLCDQQPPMGGCVSLSDSRPIADALRNTISPTPPWIPIFEPYEMIDRGLILIVDGPPGCTSEDPMQTCETAIMQVSQLKKQHVNTYVIPIGQTAEQSECLNRMALQAGTGTYPARDPSQLAQSLRQIVDKAAVSPCTIDILSPVPTDSRQVELTFYNMRVPYDSSGQNGWNFVAGVQGRIEVHGSYCDDIPPQNEINVWLICPQ